MPMQMIRINGLSLHLAIMADGKEVGGIVELLLAKIKNKNAKDSRGQTALHLAASLGKDGAIEKLLLNTDVKGAINGLDNKKWTPVHHAVNQKCKRTSEIPKSQGADTEAKHNGVDTILLFAAEEWTPEAVQILLNLKPKKEARDKHKSTPLYVAAHKNRPDVAEILVRGGTDKDAINKEDSDRTLLHMAAE